MENTLLIGDHVLVDKLVYAPAGSISRHLLPYREPRRGDIIVFRYPLNIAEDYVKRAIGLPGDHIKLVNKQLVLNGHAVNEPYAVHSTGYIDSYRDNFPDGPPGMGIYPQAIEMLESHVVNGELVVPPGFVFAMGDNRDDSLDSRYWGFVPRENIVGTPLDYLLVLRSAHPGFDQRQYRDRSYRRCAHPLLHQNPLVADIQADSRLSAAVARRRERAAIRS